MRRTQTLDDIRATLAQCRKTDSRVAMARAMLRVGNITQDARQWLAGEYAERIAAQYSKD